MTKVQKEEIVVVETVTAEQKLKALKAEMAQMKATAKAEQLQAKIEKAEAKKNLMKNGEMPPKVNTTCALIWEVCAEYREEHGIAPSSTYTKEQLPELNTHTVQTQTARYRKYVGDVGASLVLNDPFAKV